jgi:segregation and condensation protein B
VSPSQIAAAIQTQTREVEKALALLTDQYAGRGIRLQWHQGKVLLTTAPETALVVENFLGLEATSKLSRAALETLAIIAYQQPVTRPEIDSIRGVNSDGVLKSLLSKGLIEELVSRTPGRPLPPIHLRFPPAISDWLQLANFLRYPSITRYEPMDSGFIRVIKSNF